MIKQISSSMFLRFALFIAAALFSSFVLQAKSSDKTPEAVHLKTELRDNPLGLDLATPRFSWQLSADVNDVYQKSYRILVASSLNALARNQGDLWDSGVIASDRSLWVAYAGRSLRPNERCYWKVQLQTNRGLTAWSDPVMFSVGLQDEAHWQGHWIGCDSLFAGDDNGKFSRLCVRYLRKDFKTCKAIAQATLHIAGLGIYEAFLNDRRVGQQVLCPAPTDFDRSVIYSTYDVTDLLRSGDNQFLVALSGGRYFNQRHDKSNRMFGFPKLRADLILEYRDGSTETVASDASWRLSASGPVRYANLYDGEMYDARLEQLDGWMPVQEVAAPLGRLVGNLTPGMVVIDHLAPRSVQAMPTEEGGRSDRAVPTRYMIDFGQNFAGWMRIRVAGKGREGDTLRIRYAEQLQSNGELYTENLRSAACTDYYVFNGQDTGFWAPRFVYHGFRYAEVSHYPQAVTSDFVGEIVSDPMQHTGRFECDHEMLNQLYRNAYWGILGNYKGYPVDCPQRDERMPWLGDRAMGCYGEAYVMDNYTLYAKWLDDIEQAMRRDGVIPDVAPNFWKIYTDNVSWPSVFLFAADMLYRQYGDPQPIIRHYPAMKRWLDHFAATKMDSLGIIHADKYGDWCVPPESPQLIHSQDPTRVTDGALIATAYYYKMLCLLVEFIDCQTDLLTPASGTSADALSVKAQIAALQADRDHYEALAQNIKSSFNAQYFHLAAPDAGGVYYGNNTVTANLLALAFGLVPDAQREALSVHIVDKISAADMHLCCGVIGIQWLMRGLCDMGRMDVAYRLATCRTYPSWGYMIDHGATTIWELWNGNTASPKMNSGNHVMLLGDLVPWFFERIGGIRASAPAFKEIEIAPDFTSDSIRYAHVTYDSPMGLIDSHWRCADDELVWNVVIPANAKAKIHLPANAVSRKKIMSLTSGVHHICVRLKQK